MKQFFFFNVLLILISCTNLFSQNSSYLITVKNDTIPIDTYKISERKIKTKYITNKFNYNYEDLVLVYNAEEDLSYEKISPINIEYIDSYGTTFFAERLICGRVSLYRFLTNRSHSNLYAPKSDKEINYNEESSQTHVSVSNPGGRPKDEFGGGTFSGRTYSSGNSKSFYTYYIGNSDGPKELLGYNNITLSKDQFTALNVYLKDNSAIRLQLENLMYSNDLDKEKSVIALIYKFNDWYKALKSD